MRVELSQLHYRHHFNKLQSCPKQIQTIFLFKCLLILFEDICKQEHNQLPYVGQQLGKSLRTCPKNTDTDAEEN